MSYTPPPPPPDWMKPYMWENISALGRAKFHLGLWIAAMIMTVVFIATAEALSLGKLVVAGFAVFGWYPTWHYWKKHRDKGEGT